MTWLVAAAVAGLLAAWILIPLRARARAGGDAGDWGRRELMDRKHEIYRSILDLELDRATGKVSDSDYAHLRAQAEAEAVGLLRETGGAGPAPDPGDLLEAEIAAARERLRRKR